MSARYLAVMDVIAMNDEILRRMDNTASLLRDEGALESALMRPQMAAHYEEADIIAQTVVLIVGIALAHAFVDGNKRTALAAGTTFLLLNGFRFAPLPDDLPDAFGRQVEWLVVESHRLAEVTSAMTAWLRPRVVPIA